MKLPVVAVIITSLLFAACAGNDLPDEMANIINKEGVEPAIEHYKTARAGNSLAETYTSDQLVDLATKLYEQKNYEACRRILELCIETFPKDPVAYRELASLLFASGDMDTARKYFQESLKFGKPTKLQHIIVGKRLLFVPVDFEAPLIVEHERFILEPIGEKHTEMDYEAVMGSKEHLTGVLGTRSWPGNLTLAENRNALTMHEREFKNRTEFVYTVINKEKTAVIGCVYIGPSRLDYFHAEVALWVTEDEFDKGTDGILFTFVKEWLSTEWPISSTIFPNRDITWGEFFDQLDNQDQQYTE